MTNEVSSRIGGFYKLSPEARRALVEGLGVLDEEAREQFARGGLTLGDADRMSENVVSTHALPLSLALNFRVNGRDVLVPMAIEEPSIVAAASHAAKMVRTTGGFFGEADPPIMTAQVEVFDVPEPARTKESIERERRRFLSLGDAAIPRMTRRGFGCRDLEVRDLGEGVVVVHLYVDVGDAMGANVVDAVAEAVGPELARLAGGKMGLRILSNLPDRRRVRVWASVSSEALGGDAAADGIARASRFAERDPYRAVTHNKGFMNGVDAAAVALGQDFRAIEAGAHAFAAMSGRYGPLSTWRRTQDGLEGRAELPLALGTVGGVTEAHPGVRAAFQLIGVQGARELAVVVAAAGLASNLAALRALAGEGIQRGHLRLHERKRELPTTLAREVAS